MRKINTITGFILLIFFGLLSTSQVLYAQQISGTVRDKSTGAVLPGVNIAVKETTIGTSTDKDGNYELNVPSLQDTLVFSFIGYQTRQIAIAGENKINVALLSETLSGKELVVVGYGTKEKRDLTGSVSSIPTEELTQQSVSSLDQALQGKAAGVEVTTTSSQPGGGTSIRIRGTNSINSGSEPLYVIDGVPISNNLSDFSSGGARGPNSNPLATINPSDIESIQVLKDASSEAIYGARGANGVILITTKRGGTNQTNINFSSYYGVQKVRKQIPMLNATQFAKLVNDADTNAGMDALYNNPESLGEGTNWQNKLFRSAPMQNYYVSVSGGDENTQYSISGGFFKQEGIVSGSDFTRGTLKINLDKDVNDRLHIGNTLTLSRDISNGVNTAAAEGTVAAGQGVISKALQFDPILPVYQDDGEYTFENDIGGAKVGNPVAEANEIQNVRKDNRILGNVFAQYDLLKGLDVKVSFGGDAFFNKENLFAPNDLKRTIASNGEANVSSLEKFTYINENTINYETTINDKHYLHLLAGFTIQGFQTNNLLVSVQDFANNITGYHNLGSAATSLPPGTSTTESSLLSYIGRANYILNDKYLFTLTGRVDGSSKFGAGNKYGFFPSGAFAWRASDESFIKQLGLFSNLKFRVSFGLNGNQDIAPYSALALLNSTGTYFNDSDLAVGYRPTKLSNAKLKWEVTKQLDTGVDIGVLNDRLDLTFDYYQKNTSDLLLNTPIPYTTGYNSALLNVGGLKNNGLELAINTSNLVGKFSWNTSLNFSMNRNEVTNLAGTDSLIIGNDILIEGKPVSSFYGYKTEGIFQQGDDIAGAPQFANQNAQPGDRRYKDLNGDGVIDSNDRTIIGGAQPDYIFGLSNNFFYKGFELRVFLQGSVKNDVANLNKYNLEDFTGNSNNSTVALKRWTPDNPSTKYPRANAKPTIGLPFSDVIVEDASYLRIKTVTFSYNLPSTLLDKLNMRNLRIYATATNLLTLTGYDGYDPEVSINPQTNVGRGIDQGAYPSARSIRAGFDIGF